MGAGPGGPAGDDGVDEADEADGVTFRPVFAVNEVGTLVTSLVTLNQAQGGYSLSDFFSLIEIPETFMTLRTCSRKSIFFSPFTSRRKINRHSVKTFFVSKGFVLYCGLFRLLSY